MEEELEKEIQRYNEEQGGDCRYVQTARHFARWMREQIMKSPLVSIGNTASEELQRINYENGKKDMKDQMMKEAVEGEVLDLGINYLDLSLFDAEKLGLAQGDEVKFIIVKED